MDLLDRSTPVTVAVVALAGLLVGVSIPCHLAQTQPAPGSAAGPAHTLALRNVSGLNGLLTYGLDSRTVNISADQAVRTEGYEETATAVVTRTVTAGMVSITQVPEILAANPDARVLPFYLFTPDDMAGVYVPQSSDAQQLSGLQGRTLALVDRPLVTVMADTALQDIGGLPAGSVDYAYYAANASAPAADAYYLVGYPGEGFRALAFPLQELGARFGSPAPLNVFVVADEADTGVAVELVQAVNASARFGAENVEEYLEGATLRTSAEQLVRGYAARAGDVPVRRMTPDAVRYGQYILDRAAATGPTGAVNLSAAMIAADELE